MKTYLIVASGLLICGAAQASDCASAAKNAANAVIQQNAKALNITEVVMSVKQISSSASGQTYTVTSRQEENTYEWSIETSNNCQVGQVKFIGGL